MKNFRIAGVAALLLAGCGSSTNDSKAPAPASNTAAQGEYVCTMDDGRRTTPGPCPKCNMELTEKNLVPAGEAAPKGGGC
jgi:nitrous oxide reductase accessory protein NosL